MIWNTEYETMEREALRRLQFQRLQMTLRWIHNSVPFYRKAWGEVDLEPGDIKSLDDLHRVPFTNKEHFREAYPYGLFAVPMEPVSYTHLRAHETDSYLVCRL